MQGASGTDLPGTVQVALAEATVLGQGGWIEPEGWDTLAVTVSFIAIVTAKAQE